MLPFGNISERIFTHTALHYACKHTTILAVWQGRKCRLRTARAKGDILFHEREYPPLNPPRERFRLAVSGLNNLYAFGMQLPARGVAAFRVAIRFDFLLSSLSLCLRFVSLTQFPSTRDLCKFASACRGDFAALAAIYALSVVGDYTEPAIRFESGTRKGCAASVRQQSRQRLRNSG